MKTFKLLLLLSLSLFTGCATKVKLGPVAFLNCRIVEEVVVIDGAQKREYKSCDCPNGVLMWDAKRKQKIVKCGVRGGTMSERHVIRCQKCKLNQFMTLSGNCRKCKTALIPAPVAAPAVTEVTHVTCAPSATSHTSVKPPSGKLDLAFALRLFLRVFGWTQQNLADKMGVPRTYISKLTRDCCDPSLKSFRRLCAALEVSELAFVTFAEAAGRPQ